MAPLQITVLLYGLFNIGLGAFAYFHKGSLPSLIGGGSAGLVVVLAVLLTRGNPKIGYIVSAIVALVLIGRFLPKAIKEQQIYPAGVIAFVSALLLVALVVGHFMQAGGNPSDSTVSRDGG